MQDYIVATVIKVWRKELEMINVTVSTQTKLEKSPFYFAVLHWVDPIKKDQYKWKTTKIRYIDESQKRLHNQAEKDANNKAEEIRKAFEEELNQKMLNDPKSVNCNKAKQKFSDYLIEWVDNQKVKKMLQQVLLILPI